jgi:hypothetical protein
MNEKKAPKRKYPSSGGSYVRTPDGSLNQVETSTEPHPGKLELARREAEKAKSNVAALPKRAERPQGASDGKKENGNG